MNPPFTQADEWAAKAIEEAQKGCEIVFILPRHLMKRKERRAFRKLTSAGAVKLNPVSKPSSKWYKFVDPRGGSTKIGVMALHLKPIRDHKLCRYT